VYAEMNGTLLAATGMAAGADGGGRPPRMRQGVTPAAGEMINTVPHPGRNERGPGRLIRNPFEREARSSVVETAATGRGCGRTEVARGAPNAVYELIIRSRTP